MLTPDGAGEAADALGDQLGVLDEHGRLRDRAWNQHGPFGELHGLPHPPLVLVPRVRGLERVGAGADLQHDVDEVLELEVVDPRADVDAVASMPADALAREPPQRVVERLHPHLRPSTDLIDAQLGPRYVVGRQMRIVDLHEEPRVDDRLVLLAHRVGDREEIFLVGLVVGVALPVLDARRGDRRDEGLRGASRRERGLEVLDVRLNVLVTLVDHRAGAHHVQRAHGRARHRAREPLVELGKRADLARAAPRAPPAFRIGLEAGEALVDVGNEAGLAHLAVVHDVDAELGLLADDLGHRALDPQGQGIRVVGSAGGLGLDQLEQVARTRQASRVSRQDPVGAALHGRASSRGSRTRNCSRAARTRATASRRPSWSSPR